MGILAAILVPALLGYFKQAKANKDLATARTYLDAAQAKFTELYGKQGDRPVGTPVVSGARVQSTGNSDQDITNTQFARDIINLVDLPNGQEPYCFMVAVGSNAEKGKAGNYTVTVHDKYTVYYAFFMLTEDSDGWYFYNGEWTSTNPRADGTTFVFDGSNIVSSGMLQGKRLQYYLITNHNTKYQKDSIKSSAFWNWLKSMK